jgi:hypothetical protein
MDQMSAPGGGGVRAAKKAVRFFTQKTKAETTHNQLSALINSFNGYERPNPFVLGIVARRASGRGWRAACQPARIASTSIS